MKKVLKDKFPEWTVKDLKLEMDLIVGDDSDSLFSCNLLEEMTDGKWKINYFYDFENFHRHEETELMTIGVDMAFAKNTRCFDNHITQQYINSPKNHYMANPNLVYNITTGKPYHKKYPFSTLMLIMALYDIPMPKSDIGKDIILAVDSAHKGHYATSKYFKDIHTTWLERLGFTELIDRLNKNNDSYYKRIQKGLNLNGKISINKEGFLESDIKFDKLQPYFDWEITLPNKQFQLFKKYNRCGQNINKKMPERSQLISLAYTNNDYVSFTTK
ncbi:hypothetical protein MKZ02_19790 [Pseudobacillus sp. FSL P4-0506]|uniref:hypothetical protein n=1 Tax=Pseudobacillus sp. FSL P4-0506 TaxID=2921576 RepID=UPI0030FBD738